MTLNVVYKIKTMLKCLFIFVDQNETKWNVITLFCLVSSRYYYYYYYFSVFLFPVFHFRGCIWSHCALPQAPLAALFRRQQQTKLCLTQRKGQMVSQPGFVFGRKRRNDIWKNFYYIEVEKKTECVVEKDGEKCSVVKRPGTSVQSRY